MREENLEHVHRLWTAIVIWLMYLRIVRDRTVFVYMCGPTMRHRAAWVGAFHLLADCIDPTVIGDVQQRESVSAIAR